VGLSLVLVAIVSHSLQCSIIHDHNPGLIQRESLSLTICPSDNNLRHPEIKAVEPVSTASAIMIAESDGLWRRVDHGRGVYFLLFDESGDILVATQRL